MVSLELYNKMSGSDYRRQNPGGNSTFSFGWGQEEKKETEEKRLKREEAEKKKKGSEELAKKNKEES